MAYINPSRSHQALLNSLSGKIARIYNSDDLSNNLKHDIVCRLIAKSIGANSVSILLYQGIKDNLFCAGRYIDPHFTNAQSVNGQEAIDLIRIMKRIDFIEFIKIKNLQVNVSDLSQEYFDKIYNDYCNFDFSNPIKVPRNEIISFLKFYANPKEKKIIDKNYEKYWKHIREDKHSISLKEPVTGAFYYGLTHVTDNEKLATLLSRYNSIIVDSDCFVVSNLNEFPNNKLCSENLLNILGIYINTDALYIGIPLLINNRPIGILRILIRKDLEFKIPDIESDMDSAFESDKIENYFFINEQDALKYVKEIANVGSISLLLSLFIENLFFADGMRDISLKDALNRDINNLPVIADELAKVINCFGCIIRLSDSNGKSVSIMGHSTEVTGYVKALEKVGDPYISKSGAFMSVLTNLLYRKLDDSPATNNRNVIECLKVDFDKEGQPTFFYLFLDSNSRLVSSDNWEGILNSSQRKELVKIFSSVNEIFKRFDIRSIIQIPIKDQEFGLVTFANTSNRTFISKDIEMLIPVVNRLGQALKYDSSIAKGENKSKLEIQNSQRVIYHQLLSPIASLRNSFRNLEILNERNEYSTFVKRIEEVKNTLENAIDLIKLNQYLSTFFIEKKIVPNWGKIQLPSFIINKARTYQMHAKYHRGLEIHVVNEEKYIPSFHTDQTLLSHIIQALIDNAIKYSYSHIKGQYSNDINPVYAPPDIPKIILISIIYIDGEFEISVENWGCRITEKDEKSILEYMIRGYHAKDFEVVGTGIGLFLVNIIAKALNGEIIIQPKEDHTKISLKFKQSI